MLTNQIAVAILNQKPRLLARAYLSFSFSTHGISQNPTKTPVRNPPRWPRVSTFFPPSMIVRSRDKRMNIISWHILSGFLDRCCVFKMMKAM